MRTQNDIQNDIRDLRRQLDALNAKTTARAAKSAESETRKTKQRNEILGKIKEFSREYMASLTTGQF